MRRTILAAALCLAICALVGCAPGGVNPVNPTAGPATASPTDPTDDPATTLPTDAPTAAPTQAPTDAPTPSSAAGTDPIACLALAEDLILDAMVDPDGQIWITALDPDAGLSIESFARLPMDDFIETSLKGLLAWAAPEARDLAVTPCEWGEAQCGVPARAFTYLSGGNEDTMIHRGVAFQSADWLSVIIVGVYIDFEEENQARIHELLRSAKPDAALAARAARRAIPYEVPDELLSDPPEGEITLFDGLLRAKQIGTMLVEVDSADLQHYAYVYTGIVDHAGRECYGVSLIQMVNGERSENCKLLIAGDGKVYVYLDESGEYSEW